MIIYWKSNTGSYGYSEYKTHKDKYIANDIYMFFDSIVFRNNYVISKRDMNHRIKHSIDSERSIHKAVLLNLFNPKYMPFRVKEADGDENATIIYKR